MSAMLKAAKSEFSKRFLSICNLISEHLLFSMASFKRQITPKATELSLTQLLKFTTERAKLQSESLHKAEFSLCSVKPVMQAADPLEHHHCG